MLLRFNNLTKLHQNKNNFISNLAKQYSFEICVESNITSLQLYLPTKAEWRNKPFNGGSHDF